jgi:phosphatidylglycerophosphatase GEP4
MVDFRLLREIGIESLVFDLDNTISAPYAFQVEDRLTVNELFPLTWSHERQAHWDSTKRIFGPENIVIFSNSAGFYSYDRDGSLKSRAEAVLGVPVLLHHEQKPRGRADLLRHFPGRDLTKMAMVGDRVCVRQ